MNFQKIELALASDLFIRQMISIEIPPSYKQIKELSEKLPFPLSSDHIQLLERYGGSSLDEIRIEALNQIETNDGFISFANDYNGFQFIYNQKNEVYALDRDGVSLTFLANSINDFFNDILLGSAGESFYSEDWIKDLVKAGLI